MNTKDTQEIAHAALKAWILEQHAMANGRYNAWRQGRCIDPKAETKHYKEGAESLSKALQSIIQGAKL